MTKKLTIPKIENDFWVWFAGFVDGEGSIGITKVPDKRVGGDYFIYTPWLQISNTNRILYVIQDRLGMGYVGESGRVAVNCQPMHHFAIRAVADLYYVLGKLLPHLKIKHRQAQTLLSFLTHRMSTSSSKEWKSKKDIAETHYETLRRLNLKGRRANEARKREEGIYV